MSVIKEILEAEAKAEEKRLEMLRKTKENGA